MKIGKKTLKKPQNQKKTHIDFLKQFLRRLRRVVPLNSNIFHFMETREKSVVADSATNDQAPNPVAEAISASVEPATPAIPENESEEKEAANGANREVPLSENTQPDGNVDLAACHKGTLPQSKEEVIAILESLADDEAADIPREEITRLKQQFYAFRKTEIEAEQAQFVSEGNEEGAFIPAPDPSEERFKEILNRVRDRKAAIAAAQEAERQQNFERKKALIEELNTISADTDNVNRAFPRVKEIQSEFKLIGEVPPTEATDQWKAYQGAVEQFYDQLKINKDLRDYDFRKNLELKTMLCEEAEKLDAEDDVILAFKRLQNLHDEWRQAGPVAKELREEIWTRFKDASAAVNKKYQAFFEERKARESENEAAKTALCERIEALDISALKSFAAWDEMTKNILAAQEEWKKTGFASRKINNELFARFRKACDNFFTAKGDYFRSVKEGLAANLAKKTALCEQAEALKDSTDWHKTAERLVALQKEWKTIGAVAKRHSDAVWHRFQQACDSFFENRKKALSSGRNEEQANLKAKRAIIEQLKALPTDAPRNEVMPKVKELQAQWQEIGHVPFRDKDKIYDEYRALCDTFYARARDARGAMGRFEEVINDMSSDENKLYRERERIVRALEIKRNELKTYENNLGFLTSKSKSGDSMVREMERRIQRIKDDLAAIEEKVRLIDSKL